MTNQELKELIIRMLNSINDNRKLQRIYDYVHRIFINRTG